MFDFLIGLIPVIISPIIAYIISRVGIAGKKNDIEYNLKRLELVEKIKQSINSLDDSIKQKHDWSILDKEIEDILIFVDATSNREPEREHIKFQGKSRISRIFILPKPQTIGGWVATIIYYLYGIATVVYLIMFIVSPSLTLLQETSNQIKTPQETTQQIAVPQDSIQQSTTTVSETYTSPLYGLIVSLALVLIARYFAIRSFNKAIARKKKLSNSMS